MFPSLRSRTALIVTEGKLTQAIRGQGRERLVKTIRMKQSRSSCPCKGMNHLEAEIKRQRANTIRRQGLSPASQSSNRYMSSLLVGPDQGKKRKIKSFNHKTAKNQIKVNKRK